LSEYIKKKGCQKPEKQKQKNNIKREKQLQRKAKKKQGVFFLFVLFMIHNFNLLQSPFHSSASINDYRGFYLFFY